MNDEADKNDMQVALMALEIARLNLDGGQNPYDVIVARNNEIDQLRAEIARLQAAFTETGFTNAELRAEVASLRETCGHLSDRIGHWQTNAGINAMSLAQVDAEVSRLTRENAELAKDSNRLLWVFVDPGIDQIGDIDIHARAVEINDGEDEMTDAAYLQAIREAIDANDPFRLTTQQGTNE